MRHQAFRVVVLALTGLAAICGLAVIAGASAGSGKSASRTVAMVNNDWVLSPTDIYLTGGSVGVGTSSPAWQIHSSWNGTTMGAVYGQATSTGGTDTAIGVQGRTAAGLGYGVYGYATHTTGNNKGVLGQSDSSAGFGVYGYETSSTGTTRGVYGTAASSSGSGVYGDETSTSGTTYGTRGVSASSSGTGVYGQSTASSGIVYGVRGAAASSSGTGALGEATYTGNTNAVFGVYGVSQGTHAASAGVRGDGVLTGVWGNTPVGATGAAGVYGEATSNGMFTTYGVYGYSASSTNNWGVWAQGKLGASGTKSFQIDHPLDPANKFLTHYSAEGPEPYLVYRGNALLDQNGSAVVSLPDYFEAINRDWTYQLTPIGSAALLYVASEIADNSFVIAGGLPGMKVSWMVTGIRNDRYVQTHPTTDVSDKLGDEKGRYVMPELYGLSPVDGLRFVPSTTTKPTESPTR